MRVFSPSTVKHPWRTSLAYLSAEVLAICLLLILMRATRG